MVGKYTTNENVAIYDICVLLSFIIMLPFIALVKSSEPVMQAILKEQDEREKYFKNLKLSIELSLGILLVYILSSSEILYIFGETYTNGMMAFLILSCGYMILNILGSPIEILNMNGYTKVSSFVLILSLVLNIILNYYLIPIYGIVGASIATIIALLFSKIISMVFIYWKFSFNFINFYKVYIICPIFLYIGSLLSFDFWIYQILYSVFVLIAFILTIIFNDINYKHYILQNIGYKNVF
jgi:O-antigen/teichoic acid export membrane protein